MSESREAKDRSKTKKDKIPVAKKVMPKTQAPRGGMKKTGNRGAL